MCQFLTDGRAKTANDNFIGPSMGRWCKIKTNNNVEKKYYYILLVNVQAYKQLLYYFLVYLPFKFNLFTKFIKIPNT